MRLFLSVDLVGSTAFKADPKFSSSNDGDFAPAWVRVFKNFYSDFPRTLRDAHNKQQGFYELSEEERENDFPIIWKTVGDEIVFCGRVTTFEQTACCISAFVRALAEHAKRFRSAELPLSVKGTAWLAAFPAPNVSTEIVRGNVPVTEENGKKRESEIGEDEERERRADIAPFEFDFLGKGIDTGFRIAKHAQTDRLAVSVQLAYVLARSQAAGIFPFPLEYHGRETLKGVVKGLPYPIVCVDTEINEDLIELKSKEANLGINRVVSARTLRDFLEIFMKVSEVDIPNMNFRGKDRPEAPLSYKSYIRAFERDRDAEIEKLSTLSGEEIGKDDGNISDNEIFLMHVLDRTSHEHYNKHIDRILQNLKKEEE